MNITDILVSIIGGLLLVLGWFLNRTMVKLDETHAKAVKTEGALALLDQKTVLKHERLEEKMDELKDSIDNLTQELKTYNQKN